MIRSCPVCDAEGLNAARVCPSCGADVSLLDGLDRLGLRFYNEALTLARSGPPEEAIAKLNAAVGISSDHPPSWLVMGKLLAQQGAYEEALRALRRAAAGASADAEVREKAERAIARIEAIQAEREAERQAGIEARLAAERELEAQRERERAAEREAARLAARRRNIFIAAGSGVAAVLITAAVMSLPPSAASAARSVQAALDAAPGLSGRGLKAEPSGDAVLLTGELDGAQRLEAAEGVARSAAAGRKVDLSRLKVIDSQVSAGLSRLAESLPGTLRDHVPGAGRDLLDALAQTRVAAAVDPARGVRLSGAVPVEHVKPLLRDLALGLSGGRPVDLSDVRVADEYIEYRVRRGDAPESIARRLCGSARRLEAIRGFSKENAETLERMQIGDVLRIPKRLLAARPPQREKKG